MSEEFNKSSFPNQHKTMTDPLTFEHVTTEMDERMDEWLGILSKFIGIPSENPPGDTRELAEYLESLFEEHGVPYERIDPKEEMPNIVAHFEGGQGPNGPHLVYNGHLDTLHIGERDRWDWDPFSGEISDGRILGRGAADMYGGTIASLASFLYLFENKDMFGGEVTFTAVSDEETGGEWGARYLVENYPEYHGDAVISGEPSANNIIRFGERGTCWTEIRIKGEGAAASYVGGINAIEVLCDYLKEVRRLPEVDDLVNIPETVEQTIRSSKKKFDASWGEGATERVLHVTSSVGVIEGGRIGAVNVTPESSQARVDIRLPVGTSHEQVLGYLRDAADEYPGEIELERFEGSDPTYSNHEDDLFQSLQESATMVRDGAEPAFAISLAGTDCRYWREAGVPCAVYGPTPYNVGSHNEYIHLDDFKEVVMTQAAGSARYMSER